MKKIGLKLIFSTLVLSSTLIFFGSAEAAPVKFKQVVQVVSAKPGKANTSSFSTLRLVGDIDSLAIGGGDDDKDKKVTTPAPQDGRVIKTTVAEITDEGVECDCTEAIVIDKGGFPKWVLFGLGAVPLPFINNDDPTPTPTPTTATPTPTTQTPTPEPTPEPMTLLLFGTGLAGVGFAARKKFGKKGETE